MYSPSPSPCEERSFGQPIAKYLTYPQIAPKSEVGIEARPCGVHSVEKTNTFTLRFLPSALLIFIICIFTSKMFASTFTPSSFLNYRRFLLTTLDDNIRTPPSTVSAASSGSSVWSCDGRSRHGTYSPLGNVITPFYDMDYTFQDSSSSRLRRRWSSNGKSSRGRNAISQSGGFKHLSAIAAAAAATSLAFLLSSTPVQAGILSGSSGLESVPPPELPGFDLLKRIQEESKKKYEAYDGQFKSSPLVQELLKRSKANSGRYKQEIQDKYCERGAEWGVGDCSTVGMSREEREAFMEMLRKKRAPN